MHIRKNKEEGQQKARKLSGLCRLNWHDNQTLRNTYMVTEQKKRHMHWRVRSHHLNTNIKFITEAPATQRLMRPHDDEKKSQHQAPVTKTIKADNLIHQIYASEKSSNCKKSN